MPPRIGSRNPQRTRGFAARANARPRINRIRLIQERLHLFCYRRQSWWPAPELIIFARA